MTDDAVKPAPEHTGPLLEVDDLSISFPTRRGLLHAVDHVSFTLDRGRTLGVVGESGSGKTVLSRAVMSLLPSGSADRSGSVRFGGKDLTELGPSQLEHVWGPEIAMVMQDPMTSLNPVLRIGRQITESLHKHLGQSRREANATAMELLRSVGIPEPAKRMRDYPHQLSGGMRQRVTIAIALACNPALLLADEPTTALDVTVQAQILDLLGAAQRERDMAMILVTHDLGVVAGRTDDILVMYAGQVVEQAPTEVLFRDVQMPYTEALLNSIPHLASAAHTRLSAIPGRPPDLVHPPRGCRFAARCSYAQDQCREVAPPLRESEPGHLYRCWFPVGSAGTAGIPTRDAAPKRAVPAALATAAPSAESSAAEPLLQVKNLVVEFPAGRGKKVHAVSDISFELPRGETLGLVGESGCGKSTTGRAIMALPRPTSGEVSFEGTDLNTLSAEQLRAIRPRMQMIFQDPISSLNPRRTVGEIITEPLKIWGKALGLADPQAQRAKLEEVMTAVGLDFEVHADRRPHEFSGGQCQRISIARALMLDPDLIICDEPVSALDVSVQAQILNLLEDMKDRYGLTLLFIAHDLAVVKNVSDRVAVMYLGKLCELASPDLLYASPAHPYTAALLASVPVPDPGHPLDSHAGRITGDLPSPLDPPSGCRFRTRCSKAQDICAQIEPELRDHAPGQQVACHFPNSPTLVATDPAMSVAATS